MRAICRDHWSETRKIWKALSKETATLPGAERQAKEFAATRPLEGRTRKLVEEVLTADQLATLRNLVLCEDAPYGLQNPSYGLSDKQSEEYGRLLHQMQEQTEQSYRENEDKSLAVLSPQQREQIERQLGKTDLLQSAFFAIFGSRLLRLLVQAKSTSRHCSRNWGTTRIGDRQPTVHEAPRDLRISAGPRTVQALMGSCFTQRPKPAETQIARSEARRDKE